MRMNQCSTISPAIILIDPLVTAMILTIFNCSSDKDALVGFGPPRCVDGIWSDEIVGFGLNVTGLGGPRSMAVILKDSLGRGQPQR